MRHAIHVFSMAIAALLFAFSCAHDDVALETEPQGAAIEALSTPVPVLQTARTWADPTIGNTVEWSGVSTPTTGDWIGLYQNTSANDNSSLAWIYTSSCSQTKGASGRASGVCVLPFPSNSAAQDGYELRLFTTSLLSNYVRLAKSQAVKFYASYWDWANKSNVGCASVGVRTYQVHLMDIGGILSSAQWEALCLARPAMFNDLNLAPPAVCTFYTFTGEWGSFNVPDDTCTPTWMAAFKRDGCHGTGLRQYSAQLDMGSTGLDWDVACNAMQAVAVGIYFDRPTRCVHTWFAGEWGEVDVPDASCGAPGVVLPNTCN